MEFKFRAVDSRSPTQPSTIGCFSEQAFRANYPNIDPRRNLVLTGNETLQRKMEERIREEIIAQEIARRALKAEIRRELMMEREMAMRLGGAGGLTLGERLPMPLAPRPWYPLNQFDNRRLEERSAFHGPGMFNPWLQSPRVSGALMAPDIEPASEDSRNRLIVLDKPDPNHCGAKRKAAAPPEGGASGLPCVGLKKKPKEDWSCALCQVSTTSERGLNEHLQGKKHKAKEARLRASKMTKNPRSTPLPKNSSRSASITSPELEVKLEGESRQAEKINRDTDKKTGNKLDKNLQLQKNGASKLQRAALKKTKKFSFWCEMCQIGAFSAVVMEAHKRGKKHLFRLAEADRGEAVSTMTTMASPKADEKAKDTEAATETEKANEKTTEDTNDNEKITETVADNEKIMENVVGDAETVVDDEKMV